MTPAGAAAAKNTNPAMRLCDKLAAYQLKHIPVPSHKLIKTPEQLEGIRKAGKLNTAILDMVAENIKAGMSTDDINTLVHNYTVEHGGIPAPLGLSGLPQEASAPL